MKCVRSLAVWAVISSIPGVALAAGNNVYIDQIGSNSEISATQQGINNEMGSGNGTMVFRGDSQTVAINQIGSTNSIEINMQGAGSFIYSTVTGNLNSVNIDCGSGGVNKASTCVDSSMTANATGNSNSIDMVAGSKSTHDVNLTGDRNTVEVNSISSNLLGARSSITASGSDNTITLSQDGPAGAQGFNTMVELTGSSNTIGITQSGTIDSTVSVTSVGSNNSITISSGS